MSFLTSKLKNTIKFLNQSDGSLTKKTIRSGLWVGITSSGVGFLSLLKTIILARLLIPEVFGLMGICLIVIRGMRIFTETGFGAALIYRQKSFEEAKDTAFTLMVLRGFLLALITALIAPLVAHFYQKDVLEAALQVLAVSFIFTGFHNINTIALQKELDFKRLSYFEQAKAFFSFVTVVVLAFYLRSVWALVIGHVAASIVGTVLSFVIIPGRPRFTFHLRLAKELFHYGKFITGLSVVLFIATEIDNALIGKMLGMESLGYYVIAYMLANLPATHISKLATKVMFPAYSKLQDNLPVLREAYQQVLRLVGGVAIPAAMGIAVLAPEIVRLLYGEKWLPAVPALQILCVFGGFRAITSLNGYLFNAIGKPHIPFYINLGRLFLLVLLIVPMVKRFELAGVAMAVTIPLVIQFFIGVSIFSRIISLKIRKIARILIIIIANSFIMFMILYYAKYLILPVNIYTLALLVILGMMSYALLNYREIAFFARKFRPSPKR